MDQLEQAPAELLIRNVAKYALSSLVRVEHPRLVIDHGYQITRMSQQRGKPLLAFPRCLGRVLPRSLMGADAPIAKGAVTRHESLARSIALRPVGALSRNESMRQLVLSPPVREHFGHFHCIGRMPNWMRRG